MLTFLSKKTALVVVAVGTTFAMSNAAAELSAYEKGKQFGQLTAQYFIEVAKKNRAGMVALDEERMPLRDEAKAAWFQGAYDGVRTVNYASLIADAQLQQNEISCAYVMYFSTLIGIENAMIASGSQIENPLFPGLSPEEQGNVMFTKAAQAQYNNSSDEKVAAVKEAFEMFVCFELGALTPQSDADADEAAAAA